MIRIGICDEEAWCREELTFFCQRYFGEDFSYKITEYTSGEEVLAGRLPDILLLDIEMSGIDGLRVKELLEKSEKRTRIIFATSHHELALEGYGRDVLAFLTKPLDYKKFSEKMDLAIRDLRDENYYILIKGVQKCHRKILLRDVRYVKSTGRYVYFHIKNTEQPLLDDRGLIFWQRELEDKGFALARKGCLVNLSQVEEFRANEVRLFSGEKISLSRRIRESFRISYIHYLFRGAESDIEERG